MSLTEIIRNSSERGIASGRKPIGCPARVCPGKILKSGEKYLEWGNAMAQVSKVDDRGRIKLSKELAAPGSSVVIIDAQTYFLGIPIGSNPLRESGSWMKTKESVKRLKMIAENEAINDAKARAVRHKQQ
ncbi:MAG: hypothetical protein OK457_01545 [Thaumarchaeota archaeon]|nr:hypothetical protein [Nitrososphaerota archaeon]